MKSKTAHRRERQALQVCRDVVKTICVCGHADAAHLSMTGECTGRAPDACKCSRFKPAPVVCHLQHELERIAVKALIRTQETRDGHSTRDRYLSALRIIVHRIRHGDVDIGAIQRIAENAMLKRPCPNCNGTGVVESGRCSTCMGSGTVTTKE